MKVTSAEANKLIKKLNDDKLTLLSLEDRSKFYVAATIENPDDLKPEYDFDQVRAEVNRIDSEILSIKHKLNVFNCTTRVGDTGLTIDQILVKLPQLQKRLVRLDDMRRQLKKKRVSSGTQIIEYQYTNYDPKDADKLYEVVSKEITNLQMKLDVVNTTATFEV